MRMKDRTQLMFANTLEEMLQSMPLDKVRVSQLCKRCGATPPTFYYYFHDKYELVAWIFLRDFYSEVGDDAREYSPEILTQMNQRLEMHRTFYQKAFDDHSQNSIEKYLNRFNIQISENAYAYANEGASLTPAQLTEVKYHNYGVMGLFKEWLFGENTFSPDELSTFFFSRTPDFLKDAFSKYPYALDEFERK